MWDEPAVDAITALALRARSGDVAAAEEFIRSTQVDVWRTCLYLGDRGSADDLTQETYARAFASIHRFAGRSSAKTWLLAIARNVCSDAVRAAIRERSRRPEPPELTRPADDSVHLRMLLAALPLDRREAFVLTQLLGYSYAEAADVCAVGTIRSRVARARDELQAAVAADGDPRRAQQ